MDFWWGCVGWNYGASSKRFKVDASSVVKDGELMDILRSLSSMVEILRYSSNHTLLGRVKVANNDDWQGKALCKLMG